MYNWPCTLTFRIIFLFHDFAYFITYALISGFSADEEYFESQCHGTSCTHEVSCFFFLSTFAIGIGILVTYSKFPKYGCSCYEPSVIMINDQMVQMQTVTTQGQNQHFYVVQNPNQVNSQTHSTFVLTQPTQVVNQPVVVQQTAPPVTVPVTRPAWWLPPPYKKMFPTFSGIISITHVKCHILFHTYIFLYISYYYISL